MSGLSPAGFAHRVSGGRWECPKHLALLNRKLAQVAAGRIRRLMIAMPPRHGKSQFASQYFPAWYLGTFPDHRVILVGYEASFAASWGRKARDILREHGPSQFGVSVRRDAASAESWLIAGRYGGMDTAGVGGPLTGKGANLLIIDDPIKNAEDANSPTLREKAWDWYTSTAYTRLEPGGAIILIQTRWHEDDLAGRVLANARCGGEPWEVLELPALAVEDDILGRPRGEALWPNRYSVAALERTKATLGSYWFAALYQQRPAPAEGNRFKRYWFRYWSAEGQGSLYRLRGVPDRIVRARDCRRFGTVDLAVSTRTSADYTVLAAWAVTPDGDLLLIDLIRERFEEPDLIRQAVALRARHDLDYLAVEANGVQLGIVQTMRRSPHKLAVRGIVNDRDKLSRASTAIIRCEAGQIFFPERAPWLDTYESELLGFPSGAHDDQVDATSLAAHDVAWFGPSEEPDHIKLAREARAREAQETAERQWSSIDNPAFWPPHY